MRLLQFNTTVNSGSTGRIAEDIGKLFMAEGHESVIAYGRGNRPSASKLIRVGSDLDTYMHGLKTMISDRHGFGSVRATKALVKKIDELKPDVIAMHNVHGYYLNIEVLFEYFSKANIPLVWTLHDCWSFTGHCTYFDDINCTKWYKGCSHCPKLRKYPASYLADNSTKNYFDKKQLFNSVSKLELVVPSRWLGGLVKQSFMSQWPVHHVPLGVELTTFKPVISPLRTKLGLDGKKIVMGCANIWDKRKGLDDLVRLRDLLPKDHVVIAVGLNEKQADELPTGIVGVTRTESVEQLVEYYSMADVFVNPTYQDNFPVTNLESLACGTPIVTYNTGGSPEAIDVNTGKVVPKGDLDAFAEAVKELTREGKVSIGVLCRERAEKHFNKNEQYSHYIGICEKLANKN